MHILGTDTIRILYKIASRQETDTWITNIDAATVRWQVNRNHIERNIQDITGTEPNNEGNGQWDDATAVLQEMS